MEPMRTARGRATLALTLTLLAAITFTTGAAHAAPGDHFTCRASAVHVTGLGVTLAEAEPVVANDPNDPCAADSASLLSAPAALATVLSTGVSQATTSVDATSASAQSQVSNAGVLGAVLGGVHLDSLDASAGYQCVSGQPVAQSSSSVTNLAALLQAPVTTDQPQSFNFAGIASVSINDTSTTATSVTQRAVTLSLLPIVFSGVQIVLGEASAGVVGNPCAAVTPPPTTTTPTTTTPPPPPTTTTPTTSTTPTTPIDTRLHAPVLDDGPPASTPLPDATLLYHAVDQGATLSCRLDDGAPAPCSGRSAYAGLSVDTHCFEAHAERGGAVGPSLRDCWTVTPLAPGCTATLHHGYFLTAAAATLGRHRVSFHATTNGRGGRIALTTQGHDAALRSIAYRLDGRTLSHGSRMTLAYASLDRTKPHTLVVALAGASRHAQIVRHFRYVNYVSVDCDARRVVGRIAARSIVVGGSRVRLSAVVPRLVKGTTKLRFVVTVAHPRALRAVRFSIDGRRLGQHARNAALTARQLKADGVQVMRVVLVPRHGTAHALRISFRTRTS